MKSLLLLTALAFICLSAQAQISTTGSGQDAPSPTLLSKADLTVPREAKKSGIGGTLVVRVSLDTAGNVTSADKVSGPGAVCPLVDREDVRALREAAMGAALQSRFSPVLLDGVPIPSTATVSFEVKGDRNSFENALINGYELPRKAGDEKNFSAANAPPPDYKGPVNVTNKQTDKKAGDAATESDSSTKTLSGGVLNGKAQELPKPSFPAAARAVRASGSVPVQVLIDEGGNVFLARANGGHPLLRAAAVTAACGARFMPTLLSGQPVKVSGIITYNFVP